MKKSLFSLLSLALLPCAVMAESAPAKDGKHLFILSGQSNMRQPLPDAFQGVVTKVFGKDNVTFATFSVPSQPIRQWYKNWAPPEGVTFEPKPGDVNGALYDKLMASVRKAAGDQKFATVTYVWMQGEADGQAGWGAVYEKSFLGVIDQLKADLKRDDIWYVLGRINDCSSQAEGRAVVREAQVKLGSYPNGAWIDTDDLNAGINPWSVYEANGEHFPNPGYRVLGQRMARAACKQIDPNIKFDESIFDAHAFTSGSEIGKHSAIGKKTSGTAPDAGHAALTALTDGSYAGDDPASKAWVVYPATQNDVEIVVDLGEAQKVSAIATNVLVSNAAGIGFPARADYSTSKDGQTYEPLPTRNNSGLLFHGNEKITDTKGRLVLAEADRADVRYVKVIFALGKNSLYLDEIVINPEPR